MQRDNEDDAWRSIVENYGERVDLGPDEQLPSAAGEGSASARDRDDWGDAPDGSDSPARREPGEDPDEERFVPPPAPPLPRLPVDRMIAWAGVFGSPAVLLVALLAGVGLPAWLGYLLVAGFVGGFVYLVLRMPREPRDPWDDGARV